MNLQPGMPMPPEMAALLHMPEQANGGAPAAGLAGPDGVNPDAMQQMQQMQQMMMQQMMQQQQGGGMPFGIGGPGGMMPDAAAMMGMNGMNGMPGMPGMTGMMGAPGGMYRAVHHWPGG